MQASAELRWFIRGRVPSAVAGWFNGGDVVAQTESARQDIYFNLLGIDNLSIN